MWFAEMSKSELTHQKGESGLSQAPLRGVFCPSGSICTILHCIPLCCPPIFRRILHTLASSTQHIILSASAHGPLSPHPPFAVPRLHNAGLYHHHLCHHAPHGRHSSLLALAQRSPRTWWRWGRAQRRSGERRATAPGSAVARLWLWWARTSSSVGKRTRCLALLVMVTMARGSGLTYCGGVRDVG